MSRNKIVVQAEMDPRLFESRRDLARPDVLLGGVHAVVDNAPDSSKLRTLYNVDNVIKETLNTRAYYLHTQRENDITLTRPFNHKHIHDISYL